MSEGDPTLATLPDTAAFRDIVEGVSGEGTAALGPRPSSSGIPLMANTATSVASTSGLSIQEHSETSLDNCDVQGGQTISNVLPEEVDVAVSTGKRKARNEEVEIESRNTEVKDIGASVPSSSKRPRLAQDGSATPEDEGTAPTNSGSHPNPILSSAAQRLVELGVLTPTPNQVGVSGLEGVSIPRSTGKRKDRNDKEIQPAALLPTSQILSVARSSVQTSGTANQAQNGEEAPPMKKQRVDGAETLEDSAPGVPVLESDTAGTKPCPFLTLPLELLAEILILTGSPQHVLATARSCKALCQTLLNPDAEFIWRDTRKGPGCRFRLEDLRMVELPDVRKQFFSESAYAAFLFDSGNCDNCDNMTSTMYHSFGLRFRLCKRRGCEWSSKFTPLQTGDPNKDLILSAILPTNEAPPEVLSQRGPLTGPVWPGVTVPFCRSKQLRQETQRIQSKDFRKQMTLRSKRKKEWMEFCVELLLWKKSRDAQYIFNVKKNEAVTRTIATKYGWEHQEFLNTTFGPYLRNKNRLMEAINETDIKVMKDEIESRLLALSEKRGRRNTEVALMNNRKDVEKTYDNLRSNKAHPYLPSLQTFRTLPVVSMLQSAESPASAGTVYETLLKDKTMKDLLANQLKKWTESAKSDLGALLGFPKKWKNASKNILHPVERVTARFLCTKCERVDVKYRGDGCLDFAGACLHECAVGNQKNPARLRKGKKAIWDPKNFVKDEKAIKVLKKAVEALGIDEERDEGNELLRLGVPLVCTSCDPGIVLDLRSIIGHSHRHDDMQMTFATPREDLVSFMGGFPYEYGLVQPLLGPMSLTVTGKAEIDRKNFCCRHCQREKQIADAIIAALEDEIRNTEVDGQSSGGASTLEPPPPAETFTLKNVIETSSLVSRLHDVGISGPDVSPPPMFTFNGMRSHLKGKHGIEDIRDEDSFCYKPPGKF